jgi:S-adenosylmethionine:tRNA ribosyltransferase-isomerase
MINDYNLADYDYIFPKELIAQTPLKDRSASRLMILDKKDGGIEHDTFSNITDHIFPGDCLVLNNTMVIPANLDGFAEKTGAKIGILVLDNISGDRWDVLMKNSRKVQEGEYVAFGEGIRLCIIRKKGRIVEVEFNYGPEELVRRLWKAGTMPLPPYIKENIKDPSHRQRYQTVYAKNEGAKAAPTAGLHFTGDIFDRLDKKGVKLAYVTLHVGIGTFESITADDIRQHKMHSEAYEITAQDANIINTTKDSGGRVIAVGTTSMRAIESAADTHGRISQKKNTTDIYIYPGYQFRICDAIITNFHLPRTSLLVLVSAFAGKEAIRHAYDEAITNRYRLFSYGDSMLIK